MADAIPDLNTEEGIQALSKWKDALIKIRNQAIEDPFGKFWHEAVLDQLNDILEAAKDGVVADPRYVWTHYLKLAYDKLANSFNTSYGASTHRLKAEAEAKAYRSLSKGIEEITKFGHPMSPNFVQYRP